MGNLVLSPRAHQLLSFLYHKLGDAESADFEWMISHACVNGILATGDGSANNPYVVARTSDEYDIIEHFKKESVQQSLIQDNKKHLDVIKCTDGSEYWFDITNAYNHLSRSFSGRADEKGSFELVLDSAGINATRVAAVIKEGLGITSTEALRLVRSAPVKLSHEIAERVWKLGKIERKIIAAGGMAHIDRVNEDNSEQSNSGDAKKRLP